MFRRVAMFVFALIFGVPATLLAHEVGHLLVARWFGVRVLGVSIGIGRELFGFSDRHGIRWALSAWPVGGSIKIHDDRTASSGSKPDTLSSKSYAQRAAIYAAGPASNFLLALLVYGLCFLLFGEVAVPGGYSDNPAVLVACWLSYVSILVGMFNLIPIPPLDGASLAFIAFEALAKKTIPDDIMETLRMLGVIMLGVIAPLLVLVILAENF